VELHHVDGRGRSPIALDLTFSRRGSTKTAGASGGIGLVPALVAQIKFGHLWRERRLIFVRSPGSGEGSGRPDEGAGGLV
jgi:hypothetical protein